MDTSGSEPSANGDHAEQCLIHKVRTSRTFFFRLVLLVSIAEPLLDKLCASLNIMLLSETPGMRGAMRRDGAGDGHLVSNA